MVKKGTNLNSENDKAFRAGQSAVYHVTKNKKELKEVFKVQGTTESLMDFIFGKSEDNPLVRDNLGNLKGIK